MKFIIVILLIAIGVYFFINQKKIDTKNKLPRSKRVEHTVSYDTIEENINNFIKKNHVADDMKKKQNKKTNIINTDLQDESDYEEYIKEILMHKDENKKE